MVDCIEERSAALYCLGLMNAIIDNDLFFLLLGRTDGKFAWTIEALNTLYEFSWDYVRAILLEVSKSAKASRNEDTIL